MRELFEKNEFNVIKAKTTHCTIHINENKLLSVLCIKSITKAHATKLVLNFPSDLQLNLVKCYCDVL